MNIALLFCRPMGHHIGKGYHNIKISISPILTYRFPCFKRVFRSYSQPTYEADYTMLVAPSYYAKPVNRRLNILLDHKTGVTSDDVLIHLCYPRSNTLSHYHPIYSLESYTIDGGPYNLVVHILSRLLHRVTH